jgi:hypothetical protein
VLPINLQRTLLLASHVAAALFTGATGGGMGGITAAEVAVARAGLLLQLKLPSEAALRQALLMVAAPVAARAVAAARAASVGGDGQSPPAVVIAQAQHQAVVGYLANALLQSQAAAAAALAAKHAAAAAAAKQRHQASAAAIYAIAAPATAASRGSAAYLLAAPQLSPAGSSAGSADAQSQAKGRSLALGKAPADVCFACCSGVQQDGEGASCLSMPAYHCDVAISIVTGNRAVLQPTAILPYGAAAAAAGQQLWTCEGACRRTFHHACRQPASAGSLLRRCQECTDNRQAAS